MLCLCSVSVIFISYQWSVINFGLYNIHLHCMAVYVVLSASSLQPVTCYTSAPLNEIQTADISPTPVARRRRSLLAFNLTTEAPFSTDNEIRNPLVCLEQDDTLAFKVYIDNNDRTLSNYPVYVKDHMYNNNPDFDYGAFRQLEFYITETNITMSVFLHVFTDPGTYVFVDAQDANR